MDSSAALSAKLIFPYSLVRVGSLALALLIVIPNDRAAYAWIFGAGLIHFWFGSYYSWPRVRQSFNGRGRPWLIGFVIYSVFAALWHPEFLSLGLFGIHFLLSEAYFGLHDRRPGIDRYLVLRGIFEGVVYFAITFRSRFPSEVEKVLYLFVFASFLGMIWSWLPLKSIVGRRHQLDLLGCQLVTLVAFYLCFYAFDLKGYRGNLVFVLIHGSPWIVYPLAKAGFKFERRAAKQVGAYVFATFAFCAVTVPIMIKSTVFLETMAAIYFFWTNIHIFQGFFASYAAPERLRAVFY